MGQDATASIAYGVEMPEGFVYPWSEQFDDKTEKVTREEIEPEEWWLEHNKYQAPHKVWDEKGEKIAGVSNAQVDECYDHKTAFLEKVPLPFEVITLYSHDSDDYVLAAVGSEHTASEGAEKIDFKVITEGCTEQAKANFEYFIKHSIDPLVREQGVTIEKAHWLLSAHIS